MQTRRYTNHAATVASSAAVPLAGEEAEHDGVDHLSEAQLVVRCGVCGILDSSCIRYT